MTRRLILIGACLCCCSSDDFPNASSSTSQPFASSSELRSALPGSYYKDLGEGVSDSWWFGADGAFERTIVWSTGSTGGGSRTWSIEENGVVRINRFRYSVTDSVGADGGLVGTVWLRVRLASGTASFVSTGESQAQVSFFDYERIP